MKAARLANYLVTLRKEVLQLAGACGESHPALVPLDRFDIVDGFVTRPAREVFGYRDGWGAPDANETAELRRIMRRPPPASQALTG